MDEKETKAQDEMSRKQQLSAWEVVDFDGVGDFDTAKGVEVLYSTGVEADIMAKARTILDGFENVTLTLLPHTKLLGVLGMTPEEDEKWKRLRAKRRSRVEKSKSF